jgi:hypothetical protein
MLACTAAVSLNVHIVDTMHKTARQSASCLMYCESWPVSTGGDQTSCYAMYLNFTTPLNGQPAAPTLTISMMHVSFTACVACMCLSLRQVFDAMLGDPPYGVRAGGRKSKCRPDACIRNRETYIPSTSPYTLTECLTDLLELAAVLLVTGGVGKGLGFKALARSSPRCIEVLKSCFLTLVQLFGGIKPADRCLSCTCAVQSCTHIDSPPCKRVCAFRCWR